MVLLRLNVPSQAGIPLRITRSENCSDLKKKMRCDIIVYITSREDTTWNWVRR
ncbi:hypothetical protein [Ruminococcus albus]|uniref:hypothetical protein n=1 Tax=Ruminococcus albus TaxID=1264 RepID=UPI001FA83B67|nr:hypothetical protein [Ruminococcus albus]